MGLPDRYVTHGAPKLLHEEVGFTGERIAERIEAAVAESQRGPERPEAAFGGPPTVELSCHGSGRAAARPTMG